MKQFKDAHTIYKAEYADTYVTRPSVRAMTRAATPVLVMLLTLFLGVSVFFYITMNPPTPMRNTTPGPGNSLAYGDSRYFAYIDIFNYGTYRRLVTGTPTALGYSLYISCVEYHSQLACDELTVRQIINEESEKR